MLIKLHRISCFMEKAIALLSGGFDSPVAIHLMQDKVDIIAAHFHQLPLTDEKEVEKVRKLVAKCEHRDYYILSKIAMFKAAEMIAAREKAKYLITGENLAQVSSQTLSNLTAITKNVGMEIFRPVLTYDKQEIIDTAKKIGTYEISKGPELCSLLGPKSPATRSDPEKIKEQLGKLDLKKLLQESLDKAEVVEL